MLASLALAAGVVAWIAVGLVRRHALRTGLLDQPRDRGSHRIPTPRGGGLGLVLAVLAVGLPVAIFGAGLPTSAAGLAATAIIGVAAVGWIDDRRSLPVAPRFAVHLAAAASVAVLAVMTGAPAQWPALAIAVWWGLWCLSAINVVNFVDGIDGIIGAQIVVYGVHAVLLAQTYAADPAPVAAVAGTVVAGASMGFLAWNWSPARIFLGDVGSGALGVALVLTGLALCAETGASVPRVFLPLAPIFADAAATLARRARRGDRVTTPHREHLYQRLANGPDSHARTAALYAAGSAAGAAVALLPMRGLAWGAAAAVYGLALVVGSAVLERRVRGFGERIGAEARRTARAAPRVWFVSELYRPESTSTGYFVTGIAESLASRHDVRVLCARPTYSARGTTVPTRERLAGVDVRRCWSTAFPKDVLLLRVFNLVTFTASVAWAALRYLRAGDVVIVVTNPPSLPFVVLWACAARRARPVLLVHDVYPEVLTAAGVLAAGSAAARLGSAATRALYRAMERVIVLGRDMERLVRRKVGVRGPPVHVIPNWGDVAHVRPALAEAGALRARLGLADKFVVQYLGNIGRTHGIDVVAQAARALRDEPGVHFMIVGWGGRRAWLERVCAEWELTNVTVLPPCPQDELPAYLGACDVAVVAFLPGMAGVSVPSRVYNVLAAGRPVLAVADATSELALVVAEEQVGWVVEPGQPAALVAAIREARTATAVRAAMSARARASAEAKYAPVQATAAYEALLADMGVPGGAAAAVRSGEVGRAA